MKLLDFFPILLFFISYKLFGIYTATGVAIGASFIQLMYHRFQYLRFEKMHIISFGILSVLGGATLFFHNPVFIKLKPTGIYWITALLFVGSHYVTTKKPLIQRMLEEHFQLSPLIWNRLNYGWALFFVLMGSLNLYVAYNFDTDIWVNFKLFGGAGITLIFVCVQAFYLSKHVVRKELSSKTLRDDS